MTFIIANLNKKQYFRPMAFGAPQTYKCTSISYRHELIHHFGWLTLILDLLERGRGIEEPSPKGKSSQALSWYRGRIVLLRNDMKSADLVPKDIRAMRAMAQQQPVTSYDYVIEYFEDITKRMKSWWAKQPEAIKGEVCIRKAQRGKPT